METPMKKLELGVKAILTGEVYISNYIELE